MAQAKTLETLMERAASWPEDAQAELVRFMIDTEAKHFGVYRLTDEERGDPERPRGRAARPLRQRRRGRRSVRTLSKLSIEHRQLIDASWPGRRAAPCPGHPRLDCLAKKDVDARVKPAHDDVL
jgi:hypothetical protein